MNWIRDGAYSLKSNEDHTGEILKTVETTLQLKPNTDYEIGMLHSIENNGSFNIAVKSKSGEIVLDEKLANVNNANGGTSYESKFTTGDHDDYYVAIVQNADSKGPKEIIIDNVWIKDMTANVPVIGVELDIKAKELKQGEEFALKATVLPEEATNKKVTWKSSNEEVATVEEGVVTAIDEGKTTITVTTKEGTFTDTCVVTVTKEVEEVKMSVELIGEDTVESGEKLELIVSLDGITEQVYAQDITITYDDTKFILESVEGIGLNKVVEQKEKNGSIRILGAVLDEQGKVDNLGGLTGKSEIFKIGLLAKETDKVASGAISVKAEAGTVANNTSKLVEAGTAEKDVKIIAKDSPVEPEEPEVTVAHLKSMLKHYRVGAGDSKWNEAKKVDFNKNGMIDIGDFVLVAKKILGMK